MIAYVIIALYILCLSFIFFFSLSQLQLTWIYLKKKKQLKSLPTTPATWPKVCVQLPIYNEKYVVKRLIDAVAQLDYPKEQLEIQLLDDSDDESTEIITQQLKQYPDLPIVHIRRPKREGFKAGALAYGMKITDAEFIAIFDADFIPKPDFLRKTVPHFDEETGVVQTRWGHINQDYSLLTQLQAFGLDAHFSIEQVGRNASGSFINFNGTAGVWRKTCITDAGGWSADTLTEDLDLSYRAQKKGWKFKYVEDCVSPAELPVIMPAIKSQQYRWNKGGAENARKHILSIYNGQYSFSQKLHAFFHLFNSSIFVSILMAAILSVPVLWLYQQDSRFAFLTTLGMVFFFGFFSIGYFYWVAYRSLYPEKSRASFFNLFWKFIIISMGLSWHNGSAVLLGLLGKKDAFIRTPKFNIIGKNDSWLNNQYIQKSLKSLSLMEIVLALYFLVALGLAIHWQVYFLMPFHLMLAAGFLSIILFSLMPVWRKKHKSSP